MHRLLCAFAIASAVGCHASCNESSGAAPAAANGDAGTTSSQEQIPRSIGARPVMMRPVASRPSGD